MAIRRRKDDFTGKIVGNFPYPYNTPLHWLWGWGQHIDAALCNEHYQPSEFDWMFHRPSRDAYDAMMGFELDFPTIIQELKRTHQQVEDRWDEVLNNSTDETRGPYCEMLEILQHRIWKACELINQKVTAIQQSTPVQPIENAAHRAHFNQLFPKGNLENAETQECIEYLFIHRGNGKSDNELLQEKTAKSKSYCEGIQRRIRKARSDGQTTLAAN